MVPKNCPAGVSVGSWRPATVAFLMGTAQEARQQLTVPRDRWVAQMDAAAVLGMIGAHRKRHFVLSELLHLLGKKGAPRDPDVVRAAFQATYDMPVRVHGRLAACSRMERVSMLSNMYI